VFDVDVDTAIDRTPLNANLIGQNLYLEDSGLAAGVVLRFSGQD
jgi:hypothetical protein